MGSQKGQKIVESNCRYPEQEEQNMIERCVAAISRTRKDRWFINLLLWGIVVVIFGAMLVFLPMIPELDEIRGYRGSRPTFESVEARIMNSLFRVQYGTSDYSNDYFTVIDGVDPEIASLAMSIAMMPDKEITQIKEAADYDYSAMNFSGTGMYTHSYRIDPDLKKTNMYKKAAEEAKALFEAEMDRREALAQPVIRQRLLIMGLIIGIYLVIAYLIVNSCRKNGEKRLELIRTGQISITPAVMTGRKEYRSRYSHTMNIVVKAEDGQELDLEVSDLQYEHFQAGQKCYVIHYPDQDAWMWGSPDLVWDGLTD